MRALFSTLARMFCALALIACARGPEPIIIETPAVTQTATPTPTPTPTPMPPPMPPPMPTSPSLPTSAPEKIDINTADAQELDTLPRIGPAIAERIVEYRRARGPFQKIEDLLDVPGIGPATFEAIRDRIVAGR